MALLHGKYVSTTAARKCLPQLVAKVQDLREWVVLTRHGKEVAAVVSFEDLKRIFDLHDADAAARRPPPPPGLVRLPKGGFGSPRQAAEQVQKVQMDRKRERKVLEAGGLDVVEGGEVTVDAPMPRTEAEWEGWLRGEIRFAEGDKPSGGRFEDRTGGAQSRKRWWWPFGGSQT
jgi:prevent-host-death family protein